MMMPEQWPLWIRYAILGLGMLGVYLISRDIQRMIDDRVHYPRHHAIRSWR